MRPTVLVARYLTSIDDVKPETRVFTATPEGDSPVTDFVLWLRKLDVEIEQHNQRIAAQKLELQRLEKQKIRSVVRSSSLKPTTIRVMAWNGGKFDNLMVMREVYRIFGCQHTRIFGSLTAIKLVHIGNLALEDAMLATIGVGSLKSFTTAMQCPVQKGNPPPFPASLAEWHGRSADE